MLDKTWHKGQTVAPTCTEQGYTVYICDQDKNLTEKRDYTAALGHDYDNGVVTTPATCTTEGVMTYTCTRDGATKTETIPALGHKWDDGKITTAPTCETEGEKTYKCTNDGCAETKTEAVAALGHEWDNGTVTTPATCTTEGVLTYICKRDASHTKTEAIPALGHKWDDGTITTAPTCETEGKKTYKCTNDGCTETKTESVAALGHDWDDGVVTTPATCEADGVKTYTCKHDSSHTKTETIPAKKYTFTVTVVDPTCTEQGYTLHTCNQNAEKSYKDNYTDALGHDYKEVTTPATCKDAGKVENICQRCGDTQHVKDLPVTEDHKWNDGVVTKAATCTEAGEKLYTCTVCNKTKTETIEATGHDWNETTTPATCGKAGSVDRTCKACGVTEHVKDLPATGNHAWDAGTITTEATCDGKGVKTFTCTVCNETKTEEIAALGHNFSYGYCSRCGLNSNYNQKAYEQDIFEKTNSLRVNSGLSELTYRSDLQFAADIRVEEILQNYIIYGSIDGKWGAHTRPDHSSAGTALGDKSDLACGENAAMESCIFDEEHLYYLWYNSKGHRDAMLNPNANGMACAVREYNGLVFGIQIFVNDPNYTASTQSAASDTSTPVEIAAVVVADSATTETAAN